MSDLAMGASSILGTDEDYRRIQFWSEINELCKEIEARPPQPASPRPLRFLLGPGMPQLQVREMAMLAFREKLWSKLIQTRFLVPSEATASTIVMKVERNKTTLDIPLLRTTESETLVPILVTLAQVRAGLAHIQGTLYSPMQRDVGLNSHSRPTITSADFATLRTHP